MAYGGETLNQRRVRSGSQAPDLWPAMTQRRNSVLVHFSWDAIYHVRALKTEPKVCQLHQTANFNPVFNWDGGANKGGAYVYTAH